MVMSLNYTVVVDNGHNYDKISEQSWLINLSILQ